MTTPKNDSSKISRLQDYDIKVGDRCSLNSMVQKKNLGGLVVEVSGDKAKVIWDLAPDRAYNVLLKNIRREVEA